jgi:MerR family redox-sensitive transcriptional activator SoxR
MDEYSIGEVARQAGVRPSAIRFYESIGVLPPAGRVNGQRRYDEDVLSALTIIQLAQKAGFSMAEIKTLFTGFPPDTPAFERWQALAGRKLEEVTAQIEQLRAMQKLLEKALQCGCVDLAECAAICAGAQAAQA